MENASKRPKISIVTINYQMRDGLLKTIKSVISQVYENIEYIVIDGGSTDGSCEVIKQYQGHISSWESKPDNGIYDAMNKGVAMSSGDWVIFMNSDDSFYDPFVLSDIFKESHEDADLVYGNAELHYSDYNAVRLLPARSPSTLLLGMNCSHQALFVRRFLLTKFPFESGISSDYEFLLKCFIEKRRFKQVQRTIAIVSSGGASDKNRLKSIHQRWIALKKYGLTTPSLAIRHLLFAVRAVSGSIGKKILGRRVSSLILGKIGPDHSE